MTDVPAEDSLEAAIPRIANEQHAAALEEATSWVGDGVVAVGLGQTAEGAPCILVHTTIPEPNLPADVAGLPVRVEFSGPVQAYETWTGPAEGRTSRGHSGAEEQTA
jgi:hypothetical protein